MTSRNLKRDDDPQRKKQDDEIHDDVGNRCGQEEAKLVDALSRSHGDKVPRGFDGLTAKETDHGVDDSVRDEEAGQDLDDSAKGSFRAEAEIEEEQRDLGQI